MKRAKRTFTPDEKDLVFRLWKQGTGFSDIGRILNAAPGRVFTALRETGGIKRNPRKRNKQHLTLEEREEIRVALSAKMSLRAI
ncbi:helix-turn-helix domain-containing protein, partial [Vibrio parahaemolyticus]|nr:helix-turn-helix domain-containing protein [Vibrio parahaemolyticus]